MTASAHHTDRPLRLLALTQQPPDRAPSQRFRLEQWAPHLQSAHAITLEFSPFLSEALADLLEQRGHRARKLVHALHDSARRWAMRSRVREYDGVVVHRTAALLGGPWFERYLDRHRVPFIYDFDDALWVPSPSWTKHVWRMDRRLPEVCRIADGVSAGNGYLAAYARRYNPRVRVVPTSVELPALRTASEARDGAFTVLWSGSSATLPHFETARPALEELGQRVPLEVRVICNRAPAPLAHGRLTFVPWTPEAEASEMRGDVGIMPLPDTPFTRGKCGLKALQYMAAGIPPVVSPVGVNTRIVHDGKNGFLAATHAEWVEKLERLARSPDLRARLGAAAQETVEHEYSAMVSARKFADLVREAVGVAAHARGGDSSAGRRAAG